MRFRAFGSLPLVLIATATLASASAVAQEPVAAKRWWKGNLHTHSLWSDGDDFPEQIAHWYHEHGYHFLAFTEHNVLATTERWMKVDDIVRRGGRTALSAYRDRFGQEWVETRTDGEGKLEVRLKRLDEFRGKFEDSGRFLLIQAEEITDGFGDRPVHVNATNLDALVKPRKGTSVRRVMDRNLRAALDRQVPGERPVIAHLNHPNFRFGVTAEDLAAVLVDQFFEVYNGHPGSVQKGDALHADLEKLWDIACALRIDRYGAPPPLGLGTDDSHNYHVQLMRNSNSGRGWVMVRAAELSPSAIGDAMQRGDFYASSGVTLRDVDFDDGVLEVEVEPVAGEHYTIEFLGTKSNFDDRADPVRDEKGAVVAATWRYSADIGESLHRVDGTRARYRLRGDELYVRALITSSAAHDNPSFEGERKQAWTQPVGWRFRVGEHRQPGADGAEARDWPAEVVLAGDYSVPLSGMAVTADGSILWAFGEEIVRSDSTGKVLSSARLTGPILDLAVHRSEAFALVESGERPSLIRFAPTDLAVSGTVALPAAVHAARALTVSAGRLVLSTYDAERAEPLELWFLDRDGEATRAAGLSAASAIPPQSLCFADMRFWVVGAGESPQLLATDARFGPFATTAIRGSELVDLPAGLLLVGTSARTQTGRFAASAWVAEPGLDGGLRKREG
ncbi:MAG: hypothetical protein AB7I19_07135 [Planctomycetota bacterium]